MWNDLQVIATRLATVSRATVGPNQQQSRCQQLTELTQRQEQIEAELSQRSAQFRTLRSQTKLTADQLRQKLPADSAIVDLLQFSRRVEKQQPDGTLRSHFELCLAAFVIRADQPVAMIDLGTINQIDRAVNEWCSSYGGNLAGRKPEEQPGMQLRKRLWEPLAPHLEGIHTVLISPDGSAAKFPWVCCRGANPIPI